MTLRRPPLSLLAAIAFSLLLLLWLAFGDVNRFRADAPESQPRAEEALPRVEFQTSQAQRYQPSLVVQGQLMPWREVELRARASGQVASLAVEEGQDVEAGQTLLTLDQEDLPAQLERAEADLELARAELSASQRLRERDLVSRTELLRLSSGVAQASAEVARLRQSLAHTQPKAPFSGRLDRLDVEVGDYVQLGESWALLIEDDRLKADASVSQRDVHALSPGQTVTLTLLDGTPLSGEVSYVSSRADPSTRTFAIEARLDNPERRRLGGVSATLDIALEPRQAHSVSPAILVLDEEGQLGVKRLDDEDRVAFQRIDLLAATSRRAWVSGLPDTTRLITVGGGFVEVGDRVEAVAAPEQGPGDTLGLEASTLSGSGLAAPGPDEER
ncbi:efflux RND transporter periplasmic adaptor subunit [Litchfieldella xinjiangensis]|uniref:efflux RND transporter periplasmic adaptor subunit n=1 Tax=Litchfieldella xinjiangensis TaxID=1166948 RepID=UPI0009DEFF1C|nr:efflux RND transporter periplasmic adaptor subunit [Halomonas xinjiangensis]